MLSGIRRTLRNLGAFCFVFLLVWRIYELGKYTGNRLNGAGGMPDFQYTMNQEFGMSDIAAMYYREPDIPPEINVVSYDSERANATFVTLARNDDLWELAKSIRQIEDRFNRRYNYDWVFLNDNLFDTEFKRVTTSLTSGRARYGWIETEQWSYPSWIDQGKAQEAREKMAAGGVLYGDSESYRHMCRYESGFFFKHKLLQGYEYYWRVEPGIELFCDIIEDPFMVMKRENKKYGFVISMYEYEATIKSLWKSVRKFMSSHPEHIHPNNGLEFVSNDNGETYNRCHYWSNFEIGSLDFWNGQAYTDFFNQLDQDGGFFYERWGDAPVHSIAASLLLDKEEVHFFDNIGYYHTPFSHCPTSEALHTDLKCSCRPQNNFDWNSFSCTGRYFDMNGLRRPEGWRNQARL